MGYIERKPITVERLTCSHPKVDRIWEYGGLAETPTDGGMVRYVSIMLKDFTRKDFQDKGDGKAIEEAEAFLKTLD